MKDNNYIDVTKDFVLKNIKTGEWEDAKLEKVFMDKYEVFEGNEVDVLNMVFSTKENKKVLVTDCLAIGRGEWDYKENINNKNKGE